MRKGCQFGIPFFLFEFFLKSYWREFKLITYMIFTLDFWDFDIIIDLDFWINCFIIDLDFWRIMKVIGLDFCNFLFIRT